MTRRKAISVLIALALIVLTIPTSKAVVDEWVTGLCDEDLFIASYLFDGVDMVYLQGDEAQIRGWYWFEAPILMYGRYIKEAYLEVRTPSIGATDTSASMTIWGKPSGKGGTPSYYEDPHAINGPYTTNSYTVNLSSFVGPGVLHNITVTRILREINQGYYFWNGHDIAFVTLSTSDHDEERTVNSEESGHPAKLYIHYGQPDPGDPEYPPWLPSDGVFVEDYRNYTIWKVEYMEDATMPFYFSDYANNYDIYEGDYAACLDDNSDQTFVVDVGNTPEFNAINTIAMVNETIIIMEDPAQVTMYLSNDLGDTWTPQILNDQYTDLAAHTSSNCGSMYRDDNGTVHMIWNTYTDTSPAAYVAVYSNFTVLANGTIDYYDGFDEFTISHGQNNIEVDRHGRVHEGYISSSDLYYTYRNITGQWTTPVKIYEALTDTLQSVNLDVADHPNATREPVTSWFYYRAWVGIDYIQHTIRESDGTLTNTLVSSDNAFKPTSAMWRDGNITAMCYGDNPGGFHEGIRMYLYNFTTMTRSAVIDVTSQTQAHHMFCDVGVDENMGIAYITWKNTFNGGLYGRRYDLTSKTFVAAQERVTYPITSFSGASIIPNGLGGIAYTDYFIADMNGTLIDTYTTTEDNETLAIEDVEDFIDTDVIGYPDPEDPNPPGWEDTVFTAPQFKLGLLLAGLILFLGPAIYGFAERPEAATWILILFATMCGVALLWSLQTM